MRWCDAGSTPPPTRRSAIHTGGIFAALAPNTSEAVIEAVEIARKYGTIVSYDLNYRASLWKSQGGKEGAQKINRNIAKYVDVMIGNEEDFTACLGFEVEGLDEHISAIDPANFKKMIQTAVKQFPNFKVAATTLRNARTATFNDWSAILYAGGQFYQSMMRENLEIYDRVGGGDGFASGLAYGFMEGKGPQAAVEYGAAHGALAMTTPGDTSMVNVKEVEAVMKGKGARVIRVGRKGEATRVASPSSRFSEARLERAANTEQDAVARLVEGERRGVLPERRALVLAQHVGHVQRDGRLAAPRSPAGSWPTCRAGRDRPRTIPPPRGCSG